MANWEEVFTTWAAGPGTTEQSRAENAEKAVRKAIGQNQKLSQMDITVFPHGSYRNRTNVRQDSDVDICIRLNTTFFPQYPAGKTKEYFGNVDSDITFADFKSSVHQALIDYFGADYVKRGDKAFDIHENTYRVDADAIATFEHRRYVLNPDGSYYYLSGIEFKTDHGTRIINWPEQNYRNGCIKHEATGRRFKKNNSDHQAFAKRQRALPRPNRSSRV
jgi:Nucleotidyltransferase domain